MGSETYGIRTKCVNCGMEDEVNIPHGTTGEKFFKNKSCDYCKCVNCLRILPFTR